MPSDLTRISKFLSLVLRHEPGVIGVSLDASGWADGDDLVRRANEHGTAITRGLVERAVAERREGGV